MAENPSKNGQAAFPKQEMRYIDGRQVLFDAEGFLVDPDAWSRPLALNLAVEAGLPGLDREQWRVLDFLREFYYTYGRAPMNRQLKEGTGLSLMELQQMFPEGIKKGARRLAGLPNPKSCM